ncbi:toll/interleukin-1 receptor domain-containing protein [Nocardia rhizosphaerihabitans]|uniref:toll/interleukin-1 receptor domain-containing protein n=1 Tax=Nocardia rhizosphaerihabitans TaxID=1691570 RepID=UPI003670AF0C
MHAEAASEQQSGGRDESLIYDAFISYTHRDRPVAAGIQKGLHRIGRRMGQMHALRAFRDATDLTASPDLWGRVTEAMDRARFLIVVLSPRAAASIWVNKEVAHWLRGRGADRLLFVVADGHLIWDEATGRFDPHRSDAAPPVLTEPGVLPTEPLYVDVSEDAPWDPRAPMFREKVTDLAAPIHGKPKYELASEDLREQNRFRRVRRAAVATLILLTVVALAAAVIAIVQRQEAQRQRNEAVRQRNQAIALRLAADAESLLSGANARDDVRAIQQTLAAQQISAAPDPGAALQTLIALSATEKIIRTGSSWEMPTEVTRENLTRSMEAARPVFGVAVRPDGRRIATSGLQLRVWDADTGAEIDLPFPADSRALAVAYSPDGRRLVTSGVDAIIQLWDADTAAPAGEPLVGHTGLVKTVAFSPDGRHIASAGTDGTIRLWDAERRSLLRILEGHEGAVLGVAFSSDGRRLVSGGDDATVRMWNADTGDPLGAPMTRHVTAVNSVAFSTDGRLVVSGAGGPKPGSDVYIDTAAPIVVWDADTRAPVGAPFAGHDGYVTGVAFLPDSHRIVSSGGGAGLLVWDADAGTPTGPALAGHTSLVQGFAVSQNPDRPSIVSSGLDGTLRIWNAAPENSIGRPWTPSSGIAPPRTGFGGVLALESVGHRMLQVVDDPRTGRGSGWIVDLDSGRRIGPLDLPEDGTIAATTLSPNGRWLAIGFQDKTVRIWDAESGRLFGDPLTGPGDAVSTLAFSGAGDRLAAGSADKSVVVWDVDSGRPIGTPLSRPEGAVTQLALSPDGRRVATASADKSVSIWDVDSGALLEGAGGGHKADITTVVFAAGGRRVISESTDAIQLWDADTGQHLVRTETTGQLGSFALSPNGDFFVTSVKAGLQRWDATSGLPIGAPMPLPKNQATTSTSIVVTADGRYILSASEESFRIWDAVTGEQIGRPLQGPPGWILLLQVSPDSRVIRTLWQVADNSAGGVWVWPGPATWDAELCSKLTENMSREQWSSWVSPDIDYMPACPDLPERRDGN